VNIKPLFGFGGVLIAAMTSEFNDQVTAIALIRHPRSARCQLPFRNLDRKFVRVGRNRWHGNIRALAPRLDPDSGYTDDRGVAFAYENVLDIAW
jgi:hypothetical protein